MASAARILDDPVCFRPHQYLARENDRPNVIFRIEEGWACRFHLLNDGRRQITALFLPGDYCEPQWSLGQRVTRPIVALTRVRASRIACLLTGGRSSDHSRRLWIALVTTVERQADWLVSLGRKSAQERIAHLLCEIYERMESSGLAYARQCAMPLTQSVIADITGLTPVHVNRTLQAMRSAGLIRLQSRWLHIPDVDALRRAATWPALSLDAYESSQRARRRPLSVAPMEARC